MVNNSILQYILNMFNQVLQLASDIKIYNDNGITVSVLQFFIALAIMFIVLSALINFVRVQSINNVGRVKTSVSNAKSLHNTANELRSMDSNQIISWMFD